MVEDMNRKIVITTKYIGTKSFYYSVALSSDFHKKHTTRVKDIEKLTYFLQLIKVDNSDKVYVDFHWADSDVEFLEGLLVVTIKKR